MTHKEVNTKRDDKEESGCLEYYPALSAKKLSLPEIEILF